MSEIVTLEDHDRRRPVTSPEVRQALSALARTFWAAAVAEIEREIAAEREKPPEGDRGA